MRRPLKNMFTGIDQMNLAVVEFFMTISSRKFHKVAVKIICDSAVVLV
jgi:hypothetical protein